MSVADDALHGAMQFASVTSEIVDNLLELLSTIFNNSLERRELEEFLKAEKEFFKTGKITDKNNGEFAYFNSDGLDAKALYEKFKQNNIRCHVCFHNTKVDSDGIITSGTLIIKNEDIPKAKKVILNYAREITGCVHVPPSDLCKAAGSKDGLLKIDGMSYKDVWALQTIAKRDGGTFKFTSEEKSVGEGFNVYYQPKDMAKVNLALAEIAVNHDFYGPDKTVVMGRDISGRAGQIESFLEKVQNGENVRMYSGDGSSLEIRATGGEFVVYTDGRPAFRPSSNLFTDDKQGYYTELYGYLKNFNQPVFATEEEYKNGNIKETIQEKVAEIYPELEELPDSHQKAILALSKIAAQDKTEGEVDFETYLESRIGIMGENRNEQEEALLTVRTATNNFESISNHEFVLAGSKEFNELKFSNAELFDSSVLGEIDNNIEERATEINLDDLE